ncbi:MAG: hypothetical protein ACI8QS_000337 [Planctomycetota bacterium]|jgi:uncharacterized protein
MSALTGAGNRDCGRRPRYPLGAMTLMISDTDSDASYGARREVLLRQLGDLSNLAVAFSGGVDSSSLLHAATTVLGDRAVGVIADSASLPRLELHRAQDLARDMGARLVVLKTDELELEDYTRNDGLRCYWCKHTLFTRMTAWARAEGFQNLSFGEITDDALDDRPGARAAGEFGVIAPLAQAGFSKQDVRRYAREANLVVHDKPASACLASRLPRGTGVTAERLARIELAEEGLRSLGLSILRVRDHGEQARVEVGQNELEFARGKRPQIEAKLRSAGFASLELATYIPVAER